MGRLKDLVTKVKDEVAPLASVVKDEVAQQANRVKENIRERVFNAPRPQAASASASTGTAARDEWAFQPAAKPSSVESPAVGGNGAANGNGAAVEAAASSAPAAEARTTKPEEPRAPEATPAAPPAAEAAPTPAPAAAATGATPSNGAAAPSNGAAPTAPTGNIKINAQPSPTDPAVCKFTVEIPIFEERLIRIKNREAAEISPLAQKLFEIPQVTAVAFSGNVITVTKKGPEPWQIIARQVGPAIRAFISSGQPALAREPEEPANDPSRNAEVFARVQEVIDTLINPGVAGHGGFVTLLGVDGDTAYIQMGGGCHGCGMADVTLKQGIVQTIQSQVPEIQQVLDSTDHAAGANPYYAPAH